MTTNNGAGGLPELPEAVRVTVDWFDADRAVNNLYTADQMYAFRAEGIAAVLQAPGEAVAWEGRWALPLPNGTRANWTRIPKEEYDRRLRDACNPYELRALYTTPQPPPDDVLRRVVEAAQLLADLMPDAELETDAVQGEIVESLREALAAHKALAEGVGRG